MTMPGLRRLLTPLKPWMSGPAHTDGADGEQRLTGGGDRSRRLFDLQKEWCFEDRLAHGGMLYDR